MSCDEIDYFTKTLHRIKHRWDFEPDIYRIGSLHRNLSISELYAITGPILLNQWMSKINHSASSNGAGFSDRSHLTSLQTALMRRVSEAVQLTVIPLNSPISPKWRAFNALDPVTKALIKNSRVIYVDLVIPDSKYSDADRQVAGLWFEHLWHHLTIEHADRPSLPSLASSFHFDDGTKCRYLLHLIAECGLKMIHPLDLNTIRDRKSHWKAMWTAKRKFDQKARECWSSSPEQHKHSYQMFTAQWIINAIQCSFDCHRHFAQTLEELESLQLSVSYLHRNGHRLLLYRLLDGMKRKIITVLSIVLQSATKWSEMLNVPRCDIAKWEQNIDLLSVGVSVLMNSQGDQQQENEKLANSMVWSAVHWILGHRQESMLIIRKLVDERATSLDDALLTFIPSAHRVFPWIIPKSMEQLHRKQYLEQIHEITHNASHKVVNDSHPNAPKSKTRTADDVTLSFLVPFSR